MSVRNNILGHIRRRLNTHPDDGRAETVARRLGAPRANLIPARAQGDQNTLTNLFIAQAEALTATVDVLTAIEDAPQAIARFLATHNLAARIKIADHMQLRSLPWEYAPQLETKFGGGEDQDLVGLAMAFAGIAETGTLLLTSGPDGPTALNFLPDVHIVLLRKSDLVGSYEDALTRLRRLYGPGNLPRTLNFITGPSRTADIEQTIVLGAHGPRRLHILLAP